MREVTLRFANHSDCEDLFNWRNDEQTIANSPTGKVEYVNHVAWFNGKLANSTTTIFIIDNLDREKIGVIRFDKKGECSEVSINLAPQFRGQGYGKAALSKALELYFGNFEVKEITAKLNGLSRRLFFGLGFEMVDGAQSDGKFVDTVLSKQKFLNSQLKIGLKLWSTNSAWFEEAVELYKQGEVDFIEMYSVPGSFDEQKLRVLEESGIEINIHTPNELQFNLMRENEQNEVVWEEVIKFADFFDSKYIIIHPGAGTEKQVLFRNLELFNDPRIMVENVPYKPALGGDDLYGYTYGMLKEITQKVNGKFCLDFTHAIKSATSQGIDAKRFVKQLLSLKPTLFHITDGESSIEVDQHLNLGRGNFDLKFIKEMILTNDIKRVVLETPKEDNLKNDVKNIAFFKQIQVEL